MKDEKDYKAIKRWLQPGDLKKIAELCKVHRSTVSNVLRGKTQNQDILDAIISKAEERESRDKAGRERAKRLSA